MYVNASYDVCAVHVASGGRAKTGRVYYAK